MVASTCVLAAFQRKIVFAERGATITGRSPNGLGSENPPQKPGKSLLSIRVSVSLLAPEEVAAPLGFSSRAGVGMNAGSTA